MKVFRSVEEEKKRKRKDGMMIVIEISESLESLKRKRKEENHLLRSAATDLAASLAKLSLSFAWAAA